MTGILALSFVVDEEADGTGKGAIILLETLVVVLLVVVFVVVVGLALRSISSKEDGLTDDKVDRSIVGSLPESACYRVRLNSTSPFKIIIIVILNIITSPHFPFAQSVIPLFILSNHRVASRLSQEWNVIKPFFTWNMVVIYRGKN